jgi:DNA-binding NarL/FixJ family response regulator
LLITKPACCLASLTERQRLVADLISRGASNKEIGSRLNITERTVKAHLTETFRNVGVSGRLELALLLQRQSRASGD